MPLDAGSLNSRVSLQQRAGGTNEWGEPLPESWVEVSKAWANIRHPSGLATIQADAQISVVKASIRIRYRSDVKAGMRVVHGATVYKVNAVLPDEERRERLDLTCEVVN